MLNIRVVQQSDWLAWNGLYKKYLAFYSTALSEQQLALVWQWFFDSNNKIYAHLACYGDTVLGLVHFREFLRPMEASTGIFMDDLYVESDYRKQGIGSQLIKSVEDFACQKGSSVVRWITAADNYTAIRVYDQLASRTQWVTYDVRELSS